MKGGQMQWNQLLLSLYGTSYGEETPYLFRRLNFPTQGVSSRLNLGFLNVKTKRVCANTIT
jgi:hypothetical protein